MPSQAKLSKTVLKLFTIFNNKQKKLIELDCSISFLTGSDYYRYPMLFLFEFVEEAFLAALVMNIGFVKLLEQMLLLFGE